MEWELNEHGEPSQGRVEQGRFATLAGTALVTHADMLLALAAEFAPVDSAAAWERLDELGRRLFGVAALTPDDAALELIEVLRFEQGFAVGGGVPAGLMLDFVLEQRRGHPALLAVVYLETARRAGLDGTLICRDRHWYLGLETADELILVAPAPRGGPTGRNLDAQRVCPHHLAHALLGEIARCGEHERCGDLPRAPLARRLQEVLEQSV